MILAFVGVIGTPSMVVWYFEIIPKMYTNWIQFKNFQKVTITVGTDDLIRDGITSQNIEWKKNYRQYYITVKNDNDDFTIEDLRVEISAPTGVLNAEIYHQQGIDNLMVQYDENYMGELTSDDKVVSNLPSLSNQISITSIKMMPKSSFVIRIVLAYMTPPNQGNIYTNKGYLNLNYVYSNYYNKKGKALSFYHFDSSDDYLREISLSENKSMDRARVKIYSQQPPL